MSSRSGQASLWTAEESPAVQSLVSCWVATLVDSPRWNSTLYRLKWKAAATPAGRPLFRLAASVSRSARKGGDQELLPYNTPNTMDSLPPKSQKALDHELTHRPGRSQPNNLRDQVAVREGVSAWPTPRAGNTYRDTGASPSEKDGGHGWSIANAVLDSMSPAPIRAWPTPSTPSGGRSMPKDAVKIGNTITMPNGRKVQELLHHAVGTTQNKLHGRWTLALMGYPPDWCDLDDAKGEAS